MILHELHLSPRKKISRFFPFPQNCSRTFNRKNEHGKNKKKKFATILGKSEIFAEKKRFNFFHVQKINGKFREWNEKF